MVVNTKDFGYKAYLIFKYDVIEIDNMTLNVKTDKTDIELYTEYSKTDFPIYNEILKKVVKG